jgi:pimeloyl-ACP methyl ester carboxylesterase
VDRTLTAAQLDVAARAGGYGGPAFTSGAKVYRIAFRTERIAGTGPAAHDGLSSALVFVPDHPIAAKPPLVVAGHGSVGVASSCAPSLGDITATGSFLDDARSLVLPLAGYGYPVIMPDYAGFGYGGTTGWSLAEDEAHSLLDATRAMDKLLVAGSLSGEVALVGHSQGGHAVLAAQAYASSYGLAGHLAGVVAEAPLWLSPRAWGAALTDVVGLRPAVGISTLTYAIQYFYTHGEIYDGPGHGMDMFQDSMKGPLHDALTTSCLDTLDDRVSALGKHASDFFSYWGFSLGVSTCADTGVCVGSDAETWRDRFRDDRPALDTSGAPVVVINGGQDDYVTPAYAECGVEKIQADFAAATNATSTVDFCFDPEAIHGANAVPGQQPQLGVTRRNAVWINQWIAAKTLGQTAPAACNTWTTTAVDGSSISCPSLPPNGAF